tara:strand:+ start:40 stop:468 length:429 start_codon:yes stop_codon:yes gene_type:complete
MVNWKLYLREAGYFVAFLIIMGFVFHLFLNFIGMTYPSRQGSTLWVFIWFMIGSVYIQFREYKVYGTKSFFHFHYPLSESLTEREEKMWKGIALLILIVVLVINNFVFEFIDSKVGYALVLLVVIFVVYYILRWVFKTLTKQ